jgi:hypothetical protein
LWEKTMRAGLLRPAPTRKQTGSQRPERRRATRYPCGLGASRHIVAKVQPQASEAKITAHVRNISATGISLLVNRALDPETILYVELCRPSRFWFCEVPVRVVYTVQHPEGEYIVGGAFMRELTDDEVKGLLGTSRV